MFDRIAIEVAADFAHAAPPPIGTTYRSLTVCVWPDGAYPVNATQRPSGETAGRLQSPGFVTRSRIAPDATSTA